jgi:hypothetical protein
VQILLQKSFWGDERKVLEPLMRFTRGDVRDHIVSSKIDHGSPSLSSAALEVIASLPRIKNGPFLFSMSAGKRPLAMTGPINAPRAISWPGRQMPDASG